MPRKVKKRFCWRCGKREKLVEGVDFDTQTGKKETFLVCVNKACDLNKIKPYNRLERVLNSLIGELGEPYD